MKGKKICFVVPTLCMGGMERVVSLLANYAARKGCEATIICLINKESAYELHHSVRVFGPPFEYKKGVKGKLQVLRYLVFLLRKLKPDAVLSFSEVFNPLTIAAGKICAIPVYISDRSNPHKKLRMTIQLARKLVYPAATGIVAQTVLAKEMALKKRYNKNIEVIPNPLFPIETVGAEPAKKRLIVISVGRLIPTKNFGELIEIFSQIDCAESWQLWILGEGPERVNLEKQIDQLYLNDRVKLLGAVKDVERYLAKASIFAFTSVSEGFPNALSEALGHALPCIAYDCPAGPSDLIIDNKNGNLIKLHDKESFKENLKKLMVDQVLRQKLAVDYKLHRDKYSVERVAENYLSFVLG